ncbi:MAG: LLM class F420-dependent oxidoreductase [Solirubrobacteraceae bacterium]
MDLGRVGVWCGGFRLHGDRGAIRDAVAELETLGYQALFVPGGDTTDVLDAASDILAATRTVPVATGILNVWTHSPAAVAASWGEIEAKHPGRLQLGLGIGHATAIARLGLTYRRPVATMAAWIDALDGAPEPVPAQRRLLAALGPRMLALAGERTAGAHPYKVPAEHTRLARGVLGPGPLLAPEQAVVLETDPVRARELARGHIARYLTLDNYTSNFLRCGFDQGDLRDGGSDRLVDALVAWGDEERVAARVAAHFDAGADHVCIQVADVGWEDLPREQWRRLAAALLR